MKFDNIAKIKFVYFFNSLYFFAPIITLFYLSRGLDIFQTVSLEALLVLTIVFAEVPTGIIADKIGRKYSLIIYNILYLIGNIITIYGHSYEIFLFVQVLFGIGIAFASGAVEALVFDTLKFRKKEKTMSKVWGSIQSYSMIAGVFATTIGGFIARNQTESTFVLLLWLYIIGSFISLSISLFVKEREHEKEIRRRNNPTVLFKDSAKIIWHNKSLRRIVYLSVVSISFTHILLFTFQPYFLEAGVNKAFYGVAMALGTLLGAYFIRNIHKLEKRFGVKKALLFSTLLPGFLYICFAFIIGSVFSLLFFVLLKGSMDMKNPLLSQYQNNHIQSYNRATTLSIISVISSAYLFIMRIVIGKVANNNLSLAYLILGIIIIVGSLVFRIDEKHTK